MTLKGKEGVGTPPYSGGPYNWNQDLTLEGRFTRNPYRFYLEEHFSQLPQANATIDQVYTTEAARAASQHFEILGTNATDDDVTFAATIGGLQLQTDGADNDQVIVLPHLDTSATAWTGVLWGTENQVIWESTIRTDAITLVTIWAGLKLTNTSVVATDADQVFFRYAAASDTNWQAVYSIGDSDTSTDTGVAVAANTNVYFRIEIDSSRKAHFFINDNEVAVSTALTNDVDLIPYVGVHANTDATKILNVVSEKISRIIFE